MAIYLPELKKIIMSLKQILNNYSKKLCNLRLQKSSKTKIITTSKSI